MKSHYSDKREKYKMARKHVDDLKGFYGSLVAYFVTIPFLIFINYMTYWEFQWFWFPLFGWGIGIVIQAFITFGVGSNWEENKIREIMDRDNN